ncbi:MAG: hypothetical protein Kow00109_03530 [Acidobacteriota bacterium]
MPTTGTQRAAFWSAAAAAFLMIAQQVASKATRDAFFLSHFDVTALPVVLMAASVFSIVVVFLFSAALRKVNPARFVPLCFLGSGGFLMGEWWLAFFHGPAAAVALYLHVAAFGSILISGFWTLVNERFDPRTGKRIVSRIATGGTLGGLSGGLIAERMATILPVTAVLPVLAAFHVAATALLVYFLRRSAVPMQATRKVDEPNPLLASFRILRRQSYLRSLAGLVFVMTVCAAILDYVFKARATATFQSGDDLLQFFGLYYSGISLATVLVQSLLTRPALERLGVVRTIGILPLAVGGGTLANLAFPGLPTATAARAGEAILRNSLYRSAYELLYTPVPPDEKRGTKTIIDVAFDRLGDAVGGGLIRTILSLASTSALVLMLVLGTALSLLSLVLSYFLHRGYVSALERSLRSRAVALELDEVEDRTTRQTLFQTLLPDLRPPEAGTRHDDAARPAAPAPPRPAEDPLVRQVRQLRSGEAETVRRVLQEESLDRLAAPVVVELLAWDQVFPDALATLRRMAPQITGLLCDFLLDPEQEFTIRRRVPRALAACPTQRSADGLLQGLRDPRFEVRYQCGRALLLITENHPEIRIDTDLVLDAVRREVEVDRAIWVSRNPLDRDDETPTDPLDRFLRRRAGRSLEHVFNLLALVYPREPIWIAFRGLHTDDPTLRGTALEYLESILPPSIKEPLWQFLEAPATAAARASRRHEEAMQALLQSSDSINLCLEELQRKGYDPSGE